MEAIQVENNERIVNEIIAQLGGNMFFVMTGSKPQYKKVNEENPQIAFKLTRNKSKATHMTITYVSGLDLYNMEFFKCRKFEIKPVKELKGIYGDQLQEIFTEVTGLYTRLINK